MMQFSGEIERKKLPIQRTSKHTSTTCCKYQLQFFLTFLFSLAIPFFLQDVQFRISTRIHIIIYRREVIKEFC